MAQMPITEKSQIANSIARFVLAHPDLDNILDAYNMWASEQRFRCFPWGEAWMVAFSLEIFNTCIHKLSRELLDDLYYDEECILIKTH